MGWHDKMAAPIHWQQSYGKNLSRNGFCTLLSTHLSFSSAALASSNVYIARKHRKPAKQATFCSSVLCFYFQPGYCAITTTAIITKRASQCRGFSRLLHLLDWSLSKQNVLFWALYSTLLELKGCFNLAVVIPVAVLNEIAIQMQVTIRCKGIDRLQVATINFGCKLSSVCDVVVQE